jgi:hypothetical protein
MTFEELLQHLRQDADQATWEIGYMKALIDEPIVGTKLEGSLSGYALETANAAVKRSLALYCARAWDHDKDAVSLVNAATMLPSLEDLRASRLTWYPDTPYDVHLTSLPGQRDEILLKIQSASEDARHPALRIFRSEWLAHRVPNSRDRKKYAKQSAVVDITLAQLLERAVQTVNLVGELGFVADGLVNPYPDNVERAHRYSKEFWRVLPIFGDAEAI